MVILWDIVTDAKTNLIEHEFDIVCVKFSSDGKYLFTVDGGLTPSLSLWLLSGPSLIQHVYLPQKTRKRPVKNCLVEDSRSTKLLLVLENESEGYRISCWDFSKNNLNFMFVTELDSEACCNSLYFSKTVEGGFHTSEGSIIKMWKIADMGVKQQQRIHIPQQIIESGICALSGAFVALTFLGHAILLSNEVFIVTNLRVNILVY